MVRHRPGHVIVLSQLVFVAKLPMTPEIHRHRVNQRADRRMFTLSPTPIKELAS